MLLEKHGVLHIVWLFLVLLDTCMVVRDGLFTPTISVFLCHAWTRVVHVPRTPCPANLDHSEDIFEKDAKVWMPYSLLQENPRSDWYYPWQPEEGPWSRRWHELLLRALDEALEKVKSELMLLGFMSLLPTIGQRMISTIRISKNAGAAWHPCIKFEGPRRANCSEARPEVDCYQSNNVMNHASYAFDSYYQKKGRPFSSTFPRVKV